MMTTQIFRIVFEDSCLLVVEKLKPFLSQKADEGEGEGLYEFISRAKGEPLFPVHRLDRDVLGLIIFGKTKKAAEHLSEQFKNRIVEKGYEAKVWGRVREDSATLIHYLKKNPKTNYVTVYPRPTEGAKKAELVYTVIERGPSWSRLAIELKTGRSHQIRVQLAKIGHPIIGDAKYNKKENSGLEKTTIQLKSVRLSVEHPETGQMLEWKVSSQS
ncbi:MAG: pseudouridine synthase [Bacteriovoracaceae bacterium]|nr:pseudouridine synthase [Bacteriovoracaceae bacterium]